MRQKEHRLLQNIKDYTKQKNFYKRQANLSKYACIFAGCGTGFATIGAIINAIDSGITDDNTLLFTMAAIGFALATNATYETHKNTNKIAKRYLNKIQKRNRSLNKIHKTR